MKKVNFLVILSIMVLTYYLFAEDMTIGILKYRGGDWYTCVKYGSVDNFLKEVKKRTNLSVSSKSVVVDIKTDNIFNYPIILINGHGEPERDDHLLFDETEKRILRSYLYNGGFIIVNDDYGLRKSFLRFVKELFPEKELVKLPNNHPIFSSYYKFPNGCPKIHKHDGDPAQIFGIYHQGRLVLIFIYSADIVNGWDVYEIHKDPQELRDQAIKFGINILYYVLSQ